MPTLGLRWKKRLKKEFNSWKVKDCGGDGDCFFSSLGLAIGKKPRNVRVAVAKQLNRYNWKPILESYKIQADAEELEDDWEPHQVKRLQDFKKLIKQPQLIWADHNLICLAQKAYQVNCILLERSRGHNSKVYNTLAHDTTRNKYVFLDYLKDDEHIRLVSFKDQYIFSNEEIPPIMKSILELDLKIKIN